MLNVSLIDFNLNARQINSNSNGQSLSWLLLLLVVQRGARASALKSRNGINSKTSTRTKHLSRSAAERAVGVAAGAVEGIENPSASRRFGYFMLCSLRTSSGCTALKHSLSLALAHAHALHTHTYTCIHRHIRTLNAITYTCGISV